MEREDKRKRGKEKTLKTGRRERTEVREARWRNKLNGRQKGRE